MKILDAAVIRDWEERTIQSGAASVESLMHEAVKGCLAWWSSRFPIPGHAIFLIGKGHNGHDGLWLASELRLLGWHVDIVADPAALADPNFSPPAVAACRAISHTWPQVPRLPGTSCVWVDAVLGVGARGEPRGASAEILQWATQQRRLSDHAVAIDLPSGMDPDSGQIYDTCFRADWTLMIAAIKRTALAETTAPFIGRLIPIPITLSLPTPRSEEIWFDANHAVALCPTLAADTHKHRQGRLQVWAGTETMPGAAVLACRAAQACGSGLVYCHSTPQMRPTLISATPEVICLPPISETSNMPEMHATLAGPGIGRDQATSDQLAKLLQSDGPPLVLDADALTLSAAMPESLQKCPRTLVLTPHRGELASLLGRPVDDRNAAALQLAERLPRAIIVAKGPRTFITMHKQISSHNASGNPGLAAAGTGDVLAGMIAALICRGTSPLNAARLAVYLHGRAADRLARQGAECSISATRIVEALPQTWRELD